MDVGRRGGQNCLAGGGGGFLVGGGLLSGGGCINYLRNQSD